MLLLDHRYAQPDITGEVLVLPSVEAGFALQVAPHRMQEMEVLS